MNASGQQITVVQPPAQTMNETILSYGGWAGAVLAIAALVTLIYNLLMRDVKRDLAEATKTIEHNRANADTKFQKIELDVSNMEHSVTDVVSRVVKLETSLQNQEKSLDRVEKSQIDILNKLDDRFNQLATSIREVRTVQPRS